MLEEILNYLNNWFLADIYEGSFTVQDGSIELPFLYTGQYFRITGSIFNDGVYQYGESMELTDETFDGTVWALAIPKAVLSLADEITKWQEQYGAQAAGPYSSESFGGYSYSKATGTEGQNAGWQAAFAKRLAPWKKLGNPNGDYSGYQDPGFRRPFNPNYPWG